MDNKNQKYQCDLCFSKRYEVAKDLTRRLGVEDTKYRVARCSECGLLSLFPIPTEDEFNKIYQDYGTKRDRFLIEQGRSDIYREKLEKLSKFSSGTRFLDIGAGMGTFVKCAKDMGFDAHGVEYDIDQCKKAKEKHDLELINGKFEDMHAEYNDNKFDIISLHHVLEHVQSPKGVLEMAYSLLNANGILLIEVPNQFCNFRDTLKYKLFKKYELPDDRFHHLYFFSIGSLKRYIRASGFEILEVSQFRKRKNNMNVFERAVKGVFRSLTTGLGIGASGFIEAYCRKIG